MTHDQFCPIAIKHMANIMCICDVIEKVRADERERAGDRVRLAHLHLRTMNVPVTLAWLVWEKAVINACELAARGGER